MRASLCTAVLWGALLAGPAAAAPRAQMPPGAVVLPGAEMDAILQQCSRGVPARGEATWQPTAADILTLEAALPQALEHARPVQRVAWDPAKWEREYVGIVRHGRRFIYGNFVPARIMADGRAWARRDPRLAKRMEGPTVVCDGGSAFFGAEYDVAGHRFTQVDFNGYA